MRLLLLSLFLLAGLYTKAQVQVHDHNHSHSEESKWGFGGAPTLVYSFEEKAFGAGFHLHSFRLLGEKTAVGLGYEGIVAEELHHTVTLFGKYFITDYLSINLGPGLTFPSEEHNEYSLTGHVELATAFDWKGIHLGPMLGYGFSAEHSHASIGFHLGWHF